MSLCKQRLLDNFQRRFPAAPVEELKSRQRSANTSTPPPVTRANAAEGSVQCGSVGEDQSSHSHDAKLKFQSSGEERKNVYI